MRLSFLASLLILPMLAGARVDSTYVQRFPQTYTLRLYTGEKVAAFNIHDNNTGHTLEYRPNNILSLGVGITIHGIGLNLSVPMPLHDQKFDRFGRTRRLDVQVHSYQPRLMVDGYFQRYKGFHLNNTESVTRLAGPELYPFFPRMYSTTMGLSGLYVFNGDRYTMQAAFNQQSRQLRTAGSFLAGISGFGHFFDDDSSMLYQYNKYPELFEGRTPRKLGMYSLSLHGGYGFNIVFDRKARWFAGMAADGGIGLAYVTSTDVDFRYETRVSPNFGANIRIGLGYNDDRWFVGAFGVYHGNYYRLTYDDATLWASQGMVRFTVARRIFTTSSLLAKQPGSRPLFKFPD